MKNIWLYDFQLQCSAKDSDVKIQTINPLPVDYDYSRFISKSNN